MKLVCIEGKEKDSLWEITESRMTLGRDSCCDIVIHDPELSRIHAEIVQEGDASIFYDKNSMNGSFINEAKVMRQILLPGDMIRIGDTKIQVLGDDQTPNFKWQEGDSLITTKVPLDHVTHQIEEVTIISEAIVKKKRPKTSATKGTHTQKLLQNLKTIYDVGKAISSISTVDELLEQIGETLLGVFPSVQRICVLFKKGGQEFVPRFIKDRAEVHPHPFQISRSIVKKSCKERVCILASDAFQDDRFSGSESIASMNLRSFMCAPMASKEDVLGLIYLENREKPNCFDDDDLALLSALANQSAVAIENSRLYENIQKAYHESILALMNTVEAKDPYTRGHSQRTSRYALGIAQEIGLGEEECKKIKTAAELHDIGKIGVRELILDKDGTLSTTEFHSIQDHVITGENILRPIEYLSFVLPMVRHHHEKYDGTGYPDHIKRKKIPLGARIICVADAFDAMTTQRPYNKPLPIKKALKKCKEQKGKQFDPDVVDALDRYITENE